MYIMCVCMNSVNVDLEDFGTTYVVCPHCDREYEVTAEFSLAVDREEEDE